VIGSYRIAIRRHIVFFLFPIFAMLIWLVIVRLPRQRRVAAPAKA
jgi:hypothetical protein